MKIIGILMISMIASVFGRLKTKSYIFGGQVAIKMETNLEGNLIIHNHGEFPYMAEIDWFDSHWCGGSIISKSAVLTAAHCAENMDAGDVVVRAGATFLQDNGFALDSVQERNARRILIHPHHRIGADNNNDIAIIWTVTEFDFNRYVNSINLADEKNNFEGEEISVLGWGKTETGLLSDILLKATMTLIPQRLCKKIYKHYLTDQMICTFDYTSKNGSICDNDSGGPMVLHYRHNSNNDILLGVTSWSNNGQNGGCDTNAPSVFARVAAFRQWIQDNLKADTALFVDLN